MNKPVIKGFGEGAGDWRKFKCGLGLDEISLKWKDGYVKGKLRSSMPSMISL